jgi:hypothetical protein
VALYAAGLTVAAVARELGRSPEDDLAVAAAPALER